MKISVGKQSGFLWLATLFLVLGLVGCAAMKSVCPCDAPETIVVDNKSITINAEAKRLEMDGKARLNIQVMLATTDQTAFPATLTIEDYYIRPSDLSHNAFEGTFEKRTSDLENGIWLLETAVGPDWKKGELTDIAVRFIDAKGKTLFIKKDKVEIK